MSALPPAPEKPPGSPLTPTWRELLPGHPVPSLLEALEGHPAVGWMLKDAATLTYQRWSGVLPMADPRLSRAARRQWTQPPPLPPLMAAHAGSPAVEGSPQVGQTDADHFDPTPASMLRIADLRALRHRTALSEIHRIETSFDWEGVPSIEWRAWRMIIQPQPDGPRHVLVVWLELGYAERTDGLLAQAHRQIQAQQLLIAQLQSEVPQANEPTGSRGDFDEAAQRFAEQLRREADLSRREQRSFALILLAVQEMPASPMVEQALCAMVARQLSTGTRTMDTVAQLGPRHFGVLLSGAQLTPAYARAEALRRQAAQQVCLPGDQVQRVELFTGVAAYPLTADKPDALMAAAQSALAEALTHSQGRTVMARVPLNAPPAKPPR